MNDVSGSYTSGRSKRYEFSLTWVVTGVAYHLSVIVLYFKAPSKDTLLVYYPGVNSLQLFSPGNFPFFPPRTATHLQD